MIYNYNIVTTIHNRENFNYQREVICEFEFSD